MEWTLGPLQQVSLVDIDQLELGGGHRGDSHPDWNPTL